MSNKNFFNGLAVSVLMAGFLSISAPQTALAQTGTARPLWLATSADQASLAGMGFGRLAIVNGELSYQSYQFAWRIPLSQIKRVADSKVLSNALEVETLAGDRFFIAILDGRLMSTSPGKAVRTIQKAVRNAPAPPPARTALSAAGGGPM